MNQLYPIVRRVRRPLLPVDDEPRRHGDAEGTGVPATGAKEELSVETTDATRETRVVPDETAAASGDAVVATAPESGALGTARPTDEGSAARTQATPELLKVEGTPTPEPTASNPETGPGGEPRRRQRKAKP